MVIRVRCALALSFFAAFASLSCKSSSLSSGSPQSGEGGQPAQGRHGEITCAKELCAVGEQACCWPASGMVDAFCVDLPSQGSALDACLAVDSLARRVLLCDGSSDCAPDETCCLQADGESRCIASSSDGANVCERYEQCRLVEGPDVCASRETICLVTGDEGICVAAEPSVTCGGLECSGETPECCYDAAAPTSETCKAPLRCSPVNGGVAYGCTAPDDCAPGMSCCVAGGTRCFGDCEANSLRTVCDTDADCPATAPSCALDPSLLPGVRVCG